MTSCSLVSSQWLVLAAFALLVPIRSASAADVETRDFRVFVDGKAARAARMIIQKNDDGSFSVSCGTDTRVVVAGVFKAYSYTYRGREIWKGGRLAQFESTCNDNGKRYSVSAVSEGDALRVRVNGQERKTRGDVWLTSYWQLPNLPKDAPTLPLLDADTGRDLTARVQFVGEVRMSVAGTVQVARRYRLTGSVLPTDLWYDASGRLVRQTWVEDGHRVLLKLASARR